MPEWMVILCMLWAGLAGYTWGKYAGEPSAAVVPAAISNAVFDATGVRLRSIPYTPAKVKAAMQAS